jgi:cell division protein FtsZ
VEAFRKADEVLFQAVKGISDLITREGVVNVDFADVRSVMSCMGRALMGTGCAKGDGRARLAAEQAIQSPLLDEISVDGATGVLINIVGGPDMRMKEVEEAASLVQEQAHEDANIIFGASIDPDMGDAIKVTVIATGFEMSQGQMPAELSQPARRPQVVADTFSAPAPRVAAQRLETREVAAPATVRRSSGMPSSIPASRELGAPAIRPTISFASQPAAVETDWDTPAFQRRQGG